ncbi:aminotransferase class I/II-fold pyridoxal phosphate-dependent enzyme [Nonomuraea endophytica]|uniref:aminotransferase class I/II-fold pyridoxal phosphate-dependent enzyme n=1 Tax=Nonomuraea endophytica TaxID=714136 RepID=UPI0037C5C10F
MSTWGAGTRRREICTRRGADAGGAVGGRRHEALWAGGQRLGAREAGGAGQWAGGGGRGRVAVGSGAVGGWRCGQVGEGGGRGLGAGVGWEGWGIVHSNGFFRESHIVRTVTLSQSLSSPAGTVQATPEVTSTLSDSAREFTSDTAPAQARVSAAHPVVDILLSQPELPVRARVQAGELAAVARESGLETGVPAGAVVPVVRGAPETALAAAATCAEHGVRVGCLRPPPVPTRHSCLWLTARANLSSDDLAVIRHALTAVAEVKVRA